MVNFSGLSKSWAFSSSGHTPGSQVNEEVASLFGGVDPRSQRRHDGRQGVRYYVFVSAAEGSTYLGKDPERYVVYPDRYEQESFFVGPEAGRVGFFTIQYPIFSP